MKNPITTTPLTSGAMVIHVPEEVLPFFKELIRRGSNTWETAPVEIHEFVSTIGNNLKPVDFSLSSVYKTASELTNGTSQTEGRAKLK